MVPYFTKSEWFLLIYKSSVFFRKKGLYYIIIISIHFRSNKSEKWFNLPFGGVMNLTYDYIVNQKNCGEIFI